MEQKSNRCEWRERERWMRKRRVEKDGSEGWRITMGHVALLGLFGTSLSPVASGY